MKLENINIIETLIKERNSIIVFRDTALNGNRKDYLEFEGVSFKQEFKALYSENFIKEVRASVLEVCNDIIKRIEERLSEL